MAALSQGELLSQTEVLAKGLRNNLGKLKNRGIDDNFITQVEQLRNTVVLLESEQSSLRSRLKEKTEEATGALVALKTKVSEARKVVKLQIPQVGWWEFGLNDQK